MDKTISRLKEIVAENNHIVAFTGAGISSESGIPTYRGVGGLWTKYDPSIYADINYFLKDPSYYWNFFKDVRYPMLRKANPNVAHYALVDLERQGKIDCVITQNIDGLHHLAGQSNVIELHGNTKKIVCMVCKKNFQIDEVYRNLDKELPPKCSCGGILRPDVVFFGEQLPVKALTCAENAAKNCEVFMVFGSSLLVYPAAQLPLIAKRNEAILIIINIDTTPMDEIADINIHKSASQVLSEIIN